MAGLFAKGTSLWRETNTPGTFEKVANVKDIKGPDFKVTVVKTTTHSTVGNFEEKAAVLVDGGSLKFSVNYDPADATLAPATGLFEDMQSLTERNYQVRFPPSDTGNNRMNFAGFVTDHNFNFPVANVIDASITIEIDGAITWDTYA